MNVPKFTALGALAAVACAGIAWADSPIPKSGDSFTVYEEMAQWTVYADATSGSCLAERVDTAGNVMQMGLTRDQAAAYVGVFTAADMEFKAEQEIAIAVDGQVFVGEVHGIRSKTLSGGQSGGYVITNNPDLVNAIAEGQILVAFPEERGIFKVDLTGTKAAIAAIRACTAGLAG
jgi:hypothetical protein